TVLPLNVRRSKESLASRMSAPLALLRQAMESAEASRKTPLAAGFEESVTTELASTLANFSPEEPAPKGVSVLVPPVELARVKVVAVPSYFWMSSSPIRPLMMICAIYLLRQRVISPFSNIFIKLQLAHNN